MGFLFGVISFVLRKHCRRRRHNRSLNWSLQFPYEQVHESKQRQGGGTAAPGVPHQWFNVIPLTSGRSSVTGHIWWFVASRSQIGVSDAGRDLFNEFWTLASRGADLEHKCNVALLYGSAMSRRWNSVLILTRWRIRWEQQIYKFREQLSMEEELSIGRRLR